VVFKNFSKLRGDIDSQEYRRKAKISFQPILGSLSHACERMYKNKTSSIHHFDLPYV